jgi:hypothetical protein
MWRKLCDENRDFIFHARWLKHTKIGTPDTPDYAGDFWLQDQQDVMDSDALILFAVPFDRLRGALVEVGMALAYGVPVVIVGEHDDYGTWRWHPGVYWVRTIDDAINFIKSIQPKYKKIEK